MWLPDNTIEEIDTYLEEVRRRQAELDAAVPYPEVEVPVFAGWEPTPPPAYEPPAYEQPWEPTPSSAADWGVPDWLANDTPPEPNWQMPEELWWTPQRPPAEVRGFEEAINTWTPPDWAMPMTAEQTRGWEDLASTWTPPDAWLPDYSQPGAFGPSQDPNIQWLRDNPYEAAQLGLPKWRDWTDTEARQALAGTYDAPTDPLWEKGVTPGSAARAFGEAAMPLMSLNETVEQFSGGRWSLDPAYRQVERLPGGAFAVAGLDAVGSPIGLATAGWGGVAKGLATGGVKAGLRAGGEMAAKNLGATAAGLGTDRALSAYGETGGPGADIAANPWVRGLAGLGAGVAGYAGTMPALRAGARAPRALHDAAVNLDTLINEPVPFGGGRPVTAGMATRRIRPGDRLYHGTYADIGGDLQPSTHQTGIGSYAEGHSLDDGLYLTPNPETASNYAFTGDTWIMGADEAIAERAGVGAQVFPLTPTSQHNLLVWTERVTPREMRAIRKAIDDLGFDVDEFNKVFSRVRGGEGPPGQAQTGETVYYAVRDTPGIGESDVRTVLEHAGFKGIAESGRGGGVHDQLTVWDPINMEPTWNAEARRLAARQFADNLPTVQRAPAPVDTVTPPAITPEDARNVIMELPDLQPAPLRPADRVWNAVKRTVGLGVEEDPIATPAMRAREQLKGVVNSQASLLGSRAERIVTQSFDLDTNGRIKFGPKVMTPQGLDPAPTIQDLAARLPLYEPYLTPAQRAAMAALHTEVAPYRPLLERVGVEFGHRADVVDGGFYLPRGGADLEGMDMPMKVRSGRGGYGKIGAEKPAVFDSMTEGIRLGYEYRPFAEVMEAYGRSAGMRAVNQHVANYFKNVTDEAGEFVGRTMADRMPEGLRAEWADATGTVASLRDRVNTALRRLSVATGQADELDKALRNIEARVPTDAGEMAKLPGIARREGARADALQADRNRRIMTGGGPVRLDTPAPADLAERGRIIAGVVEKFSRAIPEDADRIRYLENSLDATAKRIAQLRARGGKWATEADTLQADYNAAKAAVDDLRPRYQDAMAKARQTTTRTEHGIGALPSLSGMSFPDAVANAANKYFNAELPATGKGALLHSTADAVNGLLRGLNATLDVSFMGIQGLMGAARDPIGYSRALGVAWHSLLDDTARAAHSLAFDERAIKSGLPTAREWAAAGLHQGGSNTEFAIGSHIGRAGRALATKGPLNPIRGSNRAFGDFGDVIRLELADGFLDAARKIGRNIDDPSLRREIAETVNLFSGHSPRRFGGDFGDAALFAPRFFQSQLELLAKAGGSGVGADETRIALLRLVGLGTAITVLANETSPDGLSPRQYMKPFNGDGPMGDPRKGMSGNFMRFRAGGLDMSIFGPWDSLLRGVMATASGDPTYMARSKSSPIIGLAWDLIAGESFVGKDTRNSEYLLRRLLPFSISQVGDEPPLRTAISLTGAKASQVTPYEGYDAQLKGAGMKPWAEMNAEEKRAAEKRFGPHPLSSNPDLANKQVESKATRARIDAEAAALVKRAGDDFDKTGDGKTFRDALENIAIDRRAKLGDLYRDMPEARQPEDRAVNGYFDIMDRPDVRKPDLSIDHDLFAKLSSEYLANLPEAERDYVLRQIARDKDGAVDPRAQRYYDDLDKLKEFWEAPSKLKYVEANRQIVPLLAKYGYSENTLKALAAYDEHDRTQELDDERLAKNPVGYAKEWRANLHARDQTLRDKMDGIYTKVLSAVDDRPDTTPKALRQYYTVIDELTDRVTNKVDWDAVDSWMAEQSPDARRVIDGRTRRPVTDAVKQYHEDADYIAKTGYWDVKDGAAVEYARYYGIPNVATYAQLEDRLTEMALQEARQQYPNPQQASLAAQQMVENALSRFDTTTGKATKAMRYGDMGLAQRLIRWGYWNPGKEDTQRMLGISQ